MNSPASLSFYRGFECFNFLQLLSINGELGMTKKNWKSWPWIAPFFRVATENHLIRPLPWNEIQSPASGKQGDIKS